MRIEMRAGEMIEAVVCREESFGVFLKHKGNNIFVHLPEISWTTHAPANKQGLLNTSVLVKLISYDKNEDEWTASIRKAHPELNPYSILSTSNTNVPLKAKIFSKSLGNFYALLESGALGVIVESPGEKNISVGDNVEVYLIAVDPEEGRLSLGLR